MHRLCHHSASCVGDIQPAPHASSPACSSPKLTKVINKYGLAATSQPAACQLVAPPSGSVQFMASTGDTGFTHDNMKGCLPCSSLQLHGRLHIPDPCQLRSQRQGFKGARSQLQATASPHHAAAQAAHDTGMAARLVICHSTAHAGLQPLLLCAPASTRSKTETRPSPCQNLPVLHLQLLHDPPPQPVDVVSYQACGFCESGARSLLGSSGRGLPWRAAGLVPTLLQRTQAGIMTCRPALRAHELVATCVLLTVSYHTSLEMQTTAIAAQQAPELSFLTAAPGRLY